MTVINMDEKQGAWFEMDGGGRIQITTLTADEWKELRKQTVRKKVDYHRIDGRAERFVYDDVNEDLQNELFWDKIIVEWENLIDGKGDQIACTKDNKVALMTRSAKFAKFVVDSMQTLTNDEQAQAGQAEKNS